MKNIWKKILWFILIIVGSIVGVWKLLSIKDIPFKKIEFVPYNFIYNSTDMKYIDTILHIGLLELDIDSVQIVIKKITPEISSQINDDSDYLAFIQDFDKKYILWIKPMSRKKSLYVIPHELIHLKQYYNGELKIVDGNILWDGVEFNINDVEYRKRPWEFEAYNNEDKLSNKIKNILYD